MAKIRDRAWRYRLVDFEPSPGETVTLGQLLEAMWTISENNPDGTVRFDFGVCRPQKLSGHREPDWLALNYCNSVGDGGQGRITIGEFAQMLEEALGQEFSSWDGKRVFAGHAGAPLWVDNPGCATDTAITGLMNFEDRLVIIETKHSPADAEMFKSVGLEEPAAPAPGPELAIIDDETPPASPDLSGVVARMNVETTSPVTIGPGVEIVESEFIKLDDDGEPRIAPEPDDEIISLE